MFLKWFLVFYENSLSWGYQNEVRSQEALSINFNKHTRCSTCHHELVKRLIFSYFYFLLQFSCSNRIWEDWYWKIIRPKWVTWRNLELNSSVSPFWCKEKKIYHHETYWYLKSCFLFSTLHRLYFLMISFLTWVVSHSVGWCLLESKEPSTCRTKTFLPCSFRYD